MKTPNSLKSLAIVALGLITFTSCKKNDLPVKSADEVFKPEIMKQKLEASLNGARGYGFVITQNKLIAATADSGIGSMDRAGSTMPYSIDNYINIASVTKTLTATTFQMFMRYRDLTLDSTIGRWLPDGWSKNATMNKLTFRQLLTHTSGIRSSNTSWASLKTIIANPPEGDNSRQYSNINLALFRAMLPKMNNLQVYNIEQKGTTADFERWMAERYIMIIQDNIFKKIGLENRACVEVPGKTMDMFNEAPNSIVTDGTGDWTNICGGGGFYLTTRDLSKVIVYLANTEEFLTNGEKAKMDAEMLGWWRSMAVKGGTAYGHDGALYKDVDGDKAITTGEPGLQTIILKFPNSVELALTVNSIGSNWRALYTVARDAYNGAWQL
jgi:D-alanyl-D-alanine carboxypeptidase